MWWLLLLIGNINQLAIATNDTEQRQQLKTLMTKATAFY